jgi:5-methylcytosine-specific restriction endonuclease McrA
MQGEWIRNHSNQQLMDELRSTRNEELRGCVRVVRVLEEVDRRKLYAELGYSSLYQFCLRLLSLSEHEAYLRVSAARTARRFPVIFEMLERGDKHLTAVGKLRPHLTEENHRSLLDAAKHKTKREIEEMLAARFPQPAVTESIRRLPAHARTAVPALFAPQERDTIGPLSQAPLAQASLAQPSLAQSPVEQPLAHPRLAQPPLAHSPLTQIRPAALDSPRESVGPLAIEPAAVDSPRAEKIGVPAAAPAPRRAVIEPLAPERYAVRFTASAKCRDLIERAKQLMSHRSPNADVAEVVEAALKALVEKLEKQKVKTTSRPRPQRESPRPTNSRKVPAEIVRAVHARDEGRCTYLGPDGHRCGSRALLELDHVVPIAIGGTSALDNLRLRCRTHNQLTASMQFGDEYMTLRSQGFKPRARSASLPIPGEDRRAPPS